MVKDLLKKRVYSAIDVADAETSKEDTFLIQRYTETNNLMEGLLKNNSPVSFGLYHIELCPVAKLYKIRLCSYKLYMIDNADLGLEIEGFIDSETKLVDSGKKDFCLILSNECLIRFYLTLVKFERSITHIPLYELGKPNQAYKHKMQRVIKNKMKRIIKICGRIKKD